MKIIITTIVIAGNILLLSCAKERTCKCTSKTTSTQTTTPQAGGQATTEVNHNDTENSVTIGSIKKYEMKRYADCNSGTQTSTNNHTTTISVETVSSTGTYTYMTYKSVPANVSQDNVEERTCELK